MSSLRWEFEEFNPRAVRRDPFEAEFFTGTEDSEEAYGRTDALVREALQNSLDARIDNRPAIVRFTLSGDTHALHGDSCERYLNGIAPHLKALGNQLFSHTSPTTIPFLLIEDFNTTGLLGDPARTSDPPPQASTTESFYWFWRNIGRSGKSGVDRGRWGLGKTVFPSTSRINALLGLTIRNTDRRALLMGQAITRSHKLNSKDFVPEAFYHAGDHTAGIQMPADDIETINAFLSDFRLTRQLTESGLSIVVPFPDPRLKTSDLVRSIIVHFFIAILRKELIVEVVDGTSLAARIDDASIEDVAAGLAWDGSHTEKKHCPPPFALTRWALGALAGTPPELKLAGTRTIPEWSAELFPEGMLDSLRKDLRDSGRIAIRVPMTVEDLEGAKNPCTFSVVVLRDPTINQSDDYFVRGGMTIAGIRTLTRLAHYNGLVLVDDPVLSRMLGDTEGPAHNEWNTGESRPDRTFAKWKRRVTFVRSALQKLIAYLSPPPQEINRDLLRDYFWVPGEDPASSGGAGRDGRRKRRLKPPLDPPPAPAPKPYDLEANDSGFTIHSNQQPAPKKLIVHVAYDVPSGSPLKQWSPLDFTLGKNPIQIESNGGLLSILSGQSFMFEPDAAAFRIVVRGFDSSRDLFVDPRAEHPGDEL